MLSTCEENVETPFSGETIYRTEALHHASTWLLCSVNSANEYDVALISLDVFKVLHKELF